jgi:hypothetical protein
VTTIAQATVTIQDAAPPPSTLIDTGTAFMIGLADRGTVASAGPLKASDAVTSLGEWITKSGALQSYNGNEYAAVQAFFAEGGTRLFYSRYVGPSAVKASGAVPASGSQFTAVAKAPGAWGNNLKVGVTSSVITVKDGTTVVEVSPTLTSVADAQSWATTYSTYIDITPIGSGALNNSADVTLASGADDRTNVTDTERQAALDRFGKDLGPGQVLAPGDTRTAMHQKLAQHALDRNRFALGDCPDSATAATAAAPGATARALGRDLARHIQLLGDWLIAPGINVGTTRIIPPSGVHAGLCARVDATGHPNQAVAGRAAYSRFALGVHYARTDTDRQTFADNGVTPYLVDDAVVQPFDDITPVDPNTDPEWLEASSNRFVMRVIQDALAVAKAFMFTPVSGAVDFGAYGGALSAMLLGWKTERALYGDTPADAFRVETGPAVNTPTTISAKKLRAALSLKVSPNVRNAEVLITNTPLTESL